MRLRCRCRRPCRRPRHLLPAERVDWVACEARQGRRPLGHPPPAHEVRHSSALPMPDHRQSASSKVTSQLRNVVDRVLSTGDEAVEPDEPKSKRSLIGSLDLKGLLSTSKKSGPADQKKGKSKGAAKTDA